MEPKATVSASGNHSSLIVPSGLHANFSVIIFTMAVLPSNIADATRFLGNRPRKLTKSDSHAEREKVLLLLCPQTWTMFFLQYLALFISCNF